MRVARGECGSGAVGPDPTSDGGVKVSAVCDTRSECRVVEACSGIVAEFTARGSRAGREWECRAAACGCAARPVSAGTRAATDSGLGSLLVAAEDGAISGTAVDLTRWTGFSGGGLDAGVAGLAAAAGGVGLDASDGAFDAIAVGLGCSLGSPLPPDAAIGRDVGAGAGMGAAPRSTPDGFKSSAGPAEAVVFFSDGAEVRRPAPAAAPIARITRPTPASVAKRRGPVSRLPKLTGWRSAADTTGATPNFGPSMRSAATGSVFTSAGRRDIDGAFEPTSRGSARSRAASGRRETNGRFLSRSLPISRPSFWSVP